jgi:hypothetical protein
MSSEIATRDEQQAVATTTTNHNPAAPTFTPSAGTTALMQWAQEASLAHDMATKLANTSFVPATMRGKPDEIAAAILAGSELGLKPMATLKAIDVIQGTTALRAHAMRAVVQNQGHQIELVESRNDYCKMRGRRQGEERWQEVEWDTGRAQLMGLLGKNEWKKQPKTMLVARATGELCRLIASDALHGMPYAAEELDGVAHAEVVTAKPPLSVAQLTAPAPTTSSEYSVEVGDGQWDTEVPDDDEHAAAIRELRTFADEQNITGDIDHLAYEALGAPLDDVSANAIRELTAKLRASAAQKAGAA